MHTQPSAHGDSRLNPALHLLLIWAAIVVTAAAGMWIQSSRHEDEAPAGSQEANAEVAPVSMEAEMGAKVVIAMNAIRSWSPGSSSSQVLASADPLRESSSFAERLGYSVLIGAVDGWQAGVDSAKEVEPVTQAEFALRDRVVGTMTARAAVPDAKFDASIYEELAPQLGYFARVACGDPGVVGEGFKVFIVLAAAFLWYALAFIVGAVLLVFVVLRLVMSPAPAGVPLDDPLQRRVMLICGETFALWMVAFFATSLGGAWIGSTLVDALGIAEAPAGTNLALAVSALAFLSSLGVLAYPIARGVRFAELRQALGLHRGRGFLREAASGVECYFASVPLLVSGLIVFVVLSWLWRLIFGQAPEPGHPVTGLYEGANALRVMLIFLLASVIAPIVEEIMFRGALYGHLRNTVAPRMRFLSVLIAAVASSAVFALIHPQGVLFAPALGGLAVGFCLFREARGSLVAPMVAHGINNAVTLTLGMMMMS